MVFVNLLTDCTELGLESLSVVLIVHLDVIVLVSVARVEADDAASLNQFVINNVLQHFLGIIEKLLGLLADSLVLEDLGISPVWILTTNLPSLEEWIPVNEWQ